MRGIGLSYGTPWKPSITCGPEAPRPSTKRPSLTKSRPAAVCAMHDAVRENDVEDAGADADRRRARRQVSHLADGVEAVCLGHPHQVEAGTLRAPGRLLDVGVEIARVVDHHRQLHPATIRPGPPAREALDDGGVRRARRRGGSGTNALVRATYSAYPACACWRLRSSRVTPDTLQQQDGHHHARRCSPSADAGLGGDQRDAPPHAGVAEVVGVAGVAPQPAVHHHCPRSPGRP